MTQNDEAPDTRSATQAGVCFVTGGSGGIGAAIVRRLAQAGSPVVLTYNRNRDRAEALATSVRQIGGHATTAALDLRDAAAVRHTIDRIAAEHGGIRGLVTAHGPFITMEYVSDMPPDLFRDTFESDTFAAYNVIHAAIPHLRQTRGAVVSLATAAMCPSSIASESIQRSN